jgi:hypothetical protein
MYVRIEWLNLHPVRTNSSSQLTEAFHVSTPCSRSCRQLLPSATLACRITIRIITNRLPSRTGASMHSPLPATVYCRNLPYFSARRFQKRSSLLSAWCRDSSVGYQLEDGGNGFRFPDGWDTVILFIPQSPHRFFGPPSSQSNGCQR